MGNTDPRLPLLTSSRSSSFISGTDDINPIKGVNGFLREFLAESNKLWCLAGPAIFMSVCQYSLSAITQVFAGHIGTLELAAVSVEGSVICMFVFGILLGMGSALETLCGQAYGAGQMEMLGIYMQRSWVILISTSVIFLPVYIFSAQILCFIGQTEDISRAAGQFAVWMIPELFAFAMVFPLTKFLQAQSKMMAMSVIALVALVLHTFFSWLLMLKLGWGLVGAAIVLNASWWLIVVAEMLYIFSGSCGPAWSGFSWKAFHDLWGFARLSLASAVMLCVEMWYYTVLILFAGYLKDAEISVDSLSICINILAWTLMVALGFNAAISVRVSNELGAAHPRAAKNSVVVASLTSTLFGIIMAVILVITRKQYPSLFADSQEVKDLLYQLTPMLAISIAINGLQPTLSGVAIGAGWQEYVAYVNIGSYYFFGIPLGLVLGYFLEMDVMGIWIGMMSGTFLQTLILLWMIYKTNWNKEASQAANRINEWGGKISNQSNKDEQREI